MKRIEYLLVLVFFVTFLACSSNTEQTVEKVATEILQENLIVADYMVDGMVCAMGCAKTIEDEVGDMDGVSISKVDFETGKAHFEFDKSITSEDDIKNKITSIADGQYKVSPWVDNSNVNANEEVENENLESGEGVKSEVEVSLPTFEVPNLFTFLLNKL